MNESEKDIWGDEDWKNDTCEVGLWTIDFDWKSTVWSDGRMTDVHEGTEGKGASICGSEYENKRQRFFFN